MQVPAENAGVRAAYSRLQYLVGALRGIHDPERTIVTVLTGYFDASGAPDQGTVLVVAGFISFESRWLEFERRWSAALRDGGITCFHMGELINRKGEFARWKQAKRERFLAKLIQVVIDTVVQNFGCIVVLNDWNKVNEDYKLAENDFQPYALAGWSCADRVIDWCKDHIYPAPVLVFERGDKHQSNLRRKVEGACGLIIKETRQEKPQRKTDNTIAVCGPRSVAGAERNAARRKGRHPYARRGERDGTVVVGRI
jgi:hypothetical protein